MPNDSCSCRMLIQLIDHDLRNRVALELDNDAHAIAVRFIPQIADAFDLFVVDKLGDLLDQPLLIDHVGNFADDDLLFAGAFDRLGESLAAHLNDALAFMIGLDDRLSAMNKTAGGKVRTRNMLISCLIVIVRVLDQCDQGIDHFAQIMRRDIGCHADRDARRAIDQQIRNSRRQNRGLFSESS